MKKVLVVAVHPDDETLGAGGTLLKHRKSGDEIHWAIVTEMRAEQGFLKEKIEKRTKEIESVKNDYGFQSVHRCGLDSIRLDQYPMSDLISAFKPIFEKVQPDTIYIPFKFDAHSDHRVVFDALMSFSKSFRYPFVRNIYAMEVLSETGFGILDVREGFHPQFFVDISEFIDQKVKIMGRYEGELGTHPFPRSETSIHALANLRGAMSGSKAAEAFMVLKQQW